MKRSDRVFIVGATGTGKTLLGRRLFEAHNPPRLVIDPKDDVDATGGVFRDGRVAVTFHDPGRLPDAEVARFVPRDPGDLEAYDRLYTAIFERRDVVVWLDEAGDAAPSSGAPPGLRRVVKQGRSRGIGHIATHQRPVEVDRALLGNAEHIVIFDVRHPADVGTLAGAIGIPPAELAGIIQTMPPHGFAWYSPASRQVTICDPIPTREVR